jgi:hypothetical protein
LIRRGKQAGEGECGAVGVIIMRNSGTCCLAAAHCYLLLGRVYFKERSGDLWIYCDTACPRRIQMNYDEIVEKEVQAVDDSMERGAKG